MAFIAFLDLDKAYGIWEQARQKAARIINECADLDEALLLAEDLLEETVALAGTATVNFIAFWAYVVGISKVPPIFGRENDGYLKHTGTKTRS
jgi:hypothetical protein